MFGLLYPLLAVIGLLGSALVPYISIVSGETFTKILAILSSLLTLFISGNLARNMLSERYKSRLNDLYIEVEHTDERAKKAHADALDVIFLYNRFIELSENLLRLKGYGAGGRNVSYISKQLVTLGILNVSDLDLLNEVKETRNEIAHSTRAPSRHTLNQARNSLAQLTEKITLELVQEKPF